MADIWSYIILIVLILFVLVIIRTIKRFADGDPTLWGREIKKYEKKDKEHFRENMILFVGSSSIRFWKTLEEDMSPIRVMGRGFGGSRIPDIIHYTEQIIFPYNPKALVFYAGENDINGFFFIKGSPAVIVVDNFKKFCKKIWDKMLIPIYFISIKPPKSRVKNLEEMKKSNALIKEFANREDKLYYIDITKAMQHEDGSVRKELFKFDGIHMKSEGYEIWTCIIKPILEGDFKKTPKVL